MKDVLSLLPAQPFGTNDDNRHETGALKEDALCGRSQQIAVDPLAKATAAGANGSITSKWPNSLQRRRRAFPAEADGAFCSMKQFRRGELRHLTFFPEPQSIQGSPYWKVKISGLAEALLRASQSVSGNSIFNRQHGRGGVR